MNCCYCQCVEVVHLWSRVNNMPPDHITRSVFDWSNGLVRSGKNKWVKKCKELFNKLGIGNIYDMNGLLAKV